MTEAEFQREAEAECGRLGLLWHHCCKSYLCQGPRGFPDLIALGPGGLAVLELKQPGAQLGPGQSRWAWAWRAAGVPYTVATTMAEVRSALREPVIRALGE